MALMKWTPFGDLTTFRREMDRLFERFFGELHGLEVPGVAWAPRLDLSESNARKARERGARIVISTDSHHPKHFDNLRWGVKMARRAWLGPADILNTLPLDRFRAALRRR